jgi:N-acetylmuramoyl-L-alanine amidase
MNLTKDYLTINPSNRPGIVRAETLAVVLHFVGGKSKQTAKQIRNYFESLANGPRIASAQFCIGWQGEIIQTMPENERAYHVGHAGVKDPASGKFYTDWARAKFGKYTTDPLFSPSYCTIGIEMCHTEQDGRFSKETLSACQDLCVYLFDLYKLDPATDLTTHKLTVGWKQCPLWFCTHPEDFDDFRNGLSIRMKG